MAQPTHDSALEDERAQWEEHWRGLAGQRSVFGAVARSIRLHLLNRTVRGYAERFFAEEGVMVEMGCGTGQASSLIPHRQRMLVGLDFSCQALLEARRGRGFHGLVQGDITELPFADNSLAGIWNLGVMEHFLPELGQRILGEFYRVLRPGSTMVLFWPPEYGSSRFVLAPIEILRSVFSGRSFRFFPDEVHRLRSRRHGRRVLHEAGFEVLRCDFSWRDAFIHIVAVGRKP